MEIKTYNQLARPMSVSREMMIRRVSDQADDNAFSAVYATGKARNIVLVLKDIFEDPALIMRIPIGEQIRLTSWSGSGGASGGAGRRKWYIPASGDTYNSVLGVLSDTVVNFAPEDFLILTSELGQITTIGRNGGNLFHTMEDMSKLEMNFGGTTITFRTSLSLVASDDERAVSPAEPPRVTPEHADVLKFFIQLGIDRGIFSGNASVYLTTSMFEDSAASERGRVIVALRGEPDMNHWPDQCVLCGIAITLANTTRRPMCRHANGGTDASGIFKRKSLICDSYLCGDCQKLIMFAGEDFCACDFDTALSISASSASFAFNSYNHDMGFRMRTNAKESLVRNKCFVCEESEKSSICTRMCMECMNLFVRIDNSIGHAGHATHSYDYVDEKLTVALMGITPLPRSIAILSALCTAPIGKVLQKAFVHIGRKIYMNEFE